jgi:cell wall-associated NlpC family hydrolase
MPVPAQHRRAAAIRAARNPGLLMIAFVMLASLMAMSTVVARAARVHEVTVFHAGTRPDAAGTEPDTGSAGAEPDPSSTSAPPSPSGSLVVSSAPATPPVPPVVEIPTPAARPVAAAAPADPAPAPLAGAAAAVAYALRQVGKPYRFGAAGESAFDCSGLVMRAWAEAGVSLPHSSSAMARVGRRISRDQLQPGDLVILYNYGHVQLYVGDDRIVEAPKPGSSVRVRALPSQVDALVRVSE